MPENLQTSVPSDYQSLIKQPRNSRISDRGETFLKSGAAFRGVCKDFSELFAGGFVKEIDGRRVTNGLKIERGKRLFLKETGCRRSQRQGADGIPYSACRDSDRTVV